MAATLKRISTYHKKFHNISFLKQLRLNRSTDASEEGILVSVPEVRSYIERCMVAAGAKGNHSAVLADNLVTADLRGHFSHGLNRIEIYVSDVQTGMCFTDKEPLLVRETAATAYVDGQNLLGPVVGNYSMNIAIRKAMEAGVGWVVAKDSNHYGIAAYYSTQAADAGLVGLSFTNTSPLVPPTRSIEKVLGTNPIAVAAPGKNGDRFDFDMATSAVALGKIELAAVKNEAIPAGWGADATGKVCTDPDVVIEKGAQFPLGGPETLSGYKGYGLAMMVEIFCGIMGDSYFGNQIRRWKDTGHVAHLGQCFIAVNTEMIAPGFSDRMQLLMDMCRNSQLAEGETEVLVAGDPERRHRAKCEKEGGIRYHPNQIQNSDLLANELKIEPMKTMAG